MEGDRRLKKLAESILKEYESLDAKSSMIEDEAKTLMELLPTLEEGERRRKTDDLCRRSERLMRDTQRLMKESTRYDKAAMQNNERNERKLKLSGLL